MLTLQQIKENPQYIVERLAVKGFDGKEAVDRIITLDEDRRKFQLQNDNLASELKKLADKIGALMKAGERQQAEDVKATVASLKASQKEIADNLDAAAREITEILLTVPNIPCEMVPEGKTAADNVVEKTGGPMPDLPEDALPHWELAK